MNPNFSNQYSTISKQPEFLLTPKKQQHNNNLINSNTYTYHQTAFTQNNTTFIKYPIPTQNNQVNSYPFNDSNFYLNQTPQINKNKFTSDQFTLNDVNTDQSPKKEYIKPQIEDLKETCKQLNFDLSPEVNHIKNILPELKSTQYLSESEYTEDSILNLFLILSNNDQSYQTNYTSSNAKVENICKHFYANFNLTKGLSCIIFSYLFDGFNNRNAHHLFLFLVS